MTAILEVPLKARFKTIRDVLDVVGDIAPERILLDPWPGLATEQNLLDLMDHDDRVCELIDGVLVEKPVGFPESMIAMAIAHILRAFVLPRQLGVITGEQGPYRLRLGLVRLPDVAFVSWSRVGNIETVDQIASFVPELTVEVVSPSNRPGEMEQKRQEYFRAGVLLHWSVDPRARTVSVFTRADKPDAVFQPNDSLDGGAVLPGIVVPVSEIFKDLVELESRRRAGQPE